MICWIGFSVNFVSASNGEGCRCLIMNREGNAEVVLSEALNHLGLALDQRKKELLLKYGALLLQGLASQRLTGEKTIEDLINHQICDSLFPIKKVAFEKGSRIVDLGSGGGLPGIPLAICLPDCKLHLIDSSQKKSSFLEETAQALGLKNVVIITKRAEDCGRHDAHREKYDYILSKAVAEAAVLAELALPLLLPGGKAYFYKGPRGEQEMAAAAKALKVCGGEVTNCYDYKLPEGEIRKIYVIEKIALTPAKYPRPAGKPARRPLK
jgi:16S rRNA (guanine527-N7)-methyltransferase